MNTKKFILATLAGGITMWIVAGVWHNLIIANLNSSTKHEGIGLMLVGYFILALFMAYG